MNRDKKKIHRATSDVELSSCEDESDDENVHLKIEADVDNFQEERKRHLKNVILNRIMLLKKQKRVREESNHKGNTNV